MNKWRPVSDFVFFSTKGITPKYVEKSSIIVLNQKCIRNHRIDFSLAQFADDTKNINEEKFVKRGDILINSTGKGTAGRLAFVADIPQTHKLVVDSHILILRCKTYYLAQCLSYCLFSHEKIIQSFMDGSTGQAELDKVRLFNLLITLPEDENSQKKIASILSDLDSKIELNKRINVKLEAIAKMVYDYWFVQFDFPNDNCKPYRGSGGRMKYDKILKREIPSDWSNGNLSDLIAFNPTELIPQNTIASFVGMSSLPVSGYMVKNIEKKKIQSGAKFKNGDLLLAKITPCLENGKTATITLLQDNEVAFGSTEFIVLRGKNQPLTGYISMLARSNEFRYFAISTMTGTSGRKRADEKILSTYPIAVPPREILANFESRIRVCFETLTANTKQNILLSKIRDWLLPMLMNGQVTVSVAIEQIESLTAKSAKTKTQVENKIRLPIPDSKKGFAKQVLGGKIVSLFKDDPNFTHIKFQKLQFLAEHIAEADLNLNYYFQAAGPHDGVFMNTIASHLKRNKWFEEKNYKYLPLTNQYKIDGYFQGYFSPVAERLTKLFSLLKKATEGQAEIIATLYAVWNNRIILNQPISDENLITDFYNWSSRKHQYKREQLTEALKWIRKNEMQPKGFGKEIKRAKKK